MTEGKVSVSIKMTQKQAGRMYMQNLQLREDVKALKDFAIWMTGCGYDFCQHDYFCEQRDKLLKDKP